MFLLFTAAKEKTACVKGVEICQTLIVIPAFEE